MKDIFAELAAQREKDRQRYESQDDDLCMICHAYGSDKRSLFVSCGYQMKEAVPEMIDLFACGESVKGRGYYLNLCKSCRGSLLVHFREWANERRELRPLPKDHDGHLEDEDTDDLVPVRMDGATVYMSLEDYQVWRTTR